MSRGSTRGRLSQHFGQTARRHRLASANLEHRPRAPCTACRLAISYPRWASFPGPAAGLSGPVIARLTETWTAEQRAFAERDLSGDGLCLLGPGALGSDAELGAGLGPQSGAVAGTVVICGPLTRSSRPSPQSGTGPRSPRARGRGRASDGVQAHRVSPRPLARRQRPHLVAVVRAGATFNGGKLIERSAQEAQPEAA